MPLYKLILIINFIVPQTLDTTTWSEGTNLSGARGIYRLDAAHGLQTGSFVLNFETDLSSTSNFLTPDDKNLYLAQLLSVMWSATPGLEIGFTWGFISNTNKSFVEHTIQILGKPTLHAKYSWLLQQNLGIGLAWHLLIPNAVASNNLVVKAYTMQTVLLGTYQLASWLDMTSNIGFVLDNSDKLAGDNVAPDTRFALNISGHSGVSYGLGAQSSFHLSDIFAYEPFVECTGLLASDLALQHNPLRTSLGIKTYLLQHHLFEMALGVDIRLAGKPVLGGNYPGIPAWMVFAMLNMHIYNHPTYAASTCNTNQDCPTDQTCHNNICVITNEIVTIKEVIRVQETFTLSGVVLDASNHLPVHEASVVIEGFEKTPLGVNYKTGSFVSFPIPVTKGLLKIYVNAPNYKPYEQTISGTAKERKILNIHLVKTNKSVLGRIKGSIKDAKTGKPISQAFIFIPVLSEKIIVDTQGNFSAPIKIGHYDILISAPNHQTQRKTIVIHEEEVIILDIDLYGKKHF